MIFKINYYVVITIVFSNFIKLYYLKFVIIRIQICDLSQSYMCINSDIYKI